MLHHHPTRLRRRAVAVAAALTLLAGCSGGGASDVAGAAAPTGEDAPSLKVYAFSVAKPAFDALGASFAAAPDGPGVALTASYGPSGDQSRKVAAGAPADVVSFSLEPDVTRLVDAGLVAPDWKSGPYRGTPFGSVVVLVVRKGNPKHLNDWADLLRPGVSVVTPNPLSSGSAQWNLLAPYAAYSEGGKNPDAGLAYVQELVGEHVHSRPTSGAEATESFRQGTGDVLLSYENEAIAAIDAGDDFEYVVPPQTFRIQNALAVVSTSTKPDAARSFVDHVSSKQGQEAVAKAGYRPADAAVLAAHTEFTTPDKLWTIDDLGGWPAVTAFLFDKSSGAITGIYSKATA
ncbi:MAG: extracellular solute-binding protein [Propionicimonas sp.]